MTGLLRAFDLAAIERQLGLDLNDSLFSGWAGKPALIARAIMLPAPE